jgi:uncharacterized protein (UPF0248 family)
MVLNFAANLLNRLKWTKQLPESEIVILHRGAPKDRKRIKGDHITEIKKDHFSHLDIETRKESHIPMHRVLEIWMGEKLVWRRNLGKKSAKKEKKGAGKKTVRKKSRKKTKKSTSAKKKYKGKYKK